MIEHQFFPTEEAARLGKQRNARFRDDEQRARFNVSTGASSFTIAHIADPHINMRLFPQRLEHLRNLISAALKDGVSHIVISGDIASVPDVNYWKAVRVMFKELGVYHRDKLSLVVGNHDVFGGPHSAFELIRFQRTCAATDVRQNIRAFVEVFAELFRDTVHPEDGPFPFIKIVGSRAFIGINTVAAFTLRHNPCASNGEVMSEDVEWIDAMLSALPQTHNVVIMHHHFLNHKSERLGRRAPLTKLLYWMEEISLRMRGHDDLLSLFRKHSVEAVLHGHVHISTGYEIGGIPCSNAGGSVIEREGSLLFAYNRLRKEAGKFAVKVVKLDNANQDSLGALSGTKERSLMFNQKRVGSNILLDLPIGR